VAGFVLTASACAREDGPGSTDEQAQASGVKGVTDVDIGCPPSPNANPCPRRPLGARLLFVRRDRDAPDVEVRTGEDGTFTVNLFPGRYEVVQDNLTGAPYPRADRMTLEVRQGTFTTITVMFDSGVR